MRWHRHLVFAALLLPTQAIASSNAYQRVSWTFDLPERISPTAFSVCSQHDCRTRSPVQLDREQWNRIVALFTPQAQSAAAEREQIARAIGRMEQLVAGFANTHHDKAGDFNGFTQPGSQLDCVDESVNTTTYLTLFEQQGLLRWHRVLPRASRGYMLFGGWPHFTAVVETTRGKPEQWVIDSWFRDNGVNADVLPLTTWKDGWSPEGFSM